MAALRAIGVATILALPLGIVSGAQISPASLFVLSVAAGFTFWEYAARAPMLISFRDARPYNLLRALLCAIVLFVLSTALDTTVQTPLAELIREAGGRLPALPLGGTLWVNLPDTMGPVAQAATAIVLILSAVICAVFLLLCLNGWPGRGLNVWAALPTLGLSSEQSPAGHLLMLAVVNLILGGMVLLVYPIAFSGVLSALGQGRDLGPLGLIWGLAGWAIIPSFLVLRGCALLRVAQLVARQQRGSGPVSLA